MLRYDSGAWVLAQADVPDNSEALGIVSVVAGVDDFTVVTEGRITLSGLTADTVYFLSDTVAGGYQIAEPAISKPLMYAQSATEAIVRIRRGANLALTDPSITVADEGVDLTAQVMRFNFVGDGVTVTEPITDEVQVTIPAGGSDVEVEDEGTSLTTAVQKINFVGAGVTVTEPVTDEVEVTIPGGGGSALPKYEFYADQFENPVTADWAINALAPAIPDPTNSALIVRQFDDATETGVGFSFQVPVGATNMSLLFIMRAATTPGVATTDVDWTLRSREIPDNAAIPAWANFAGGAADLGDFPTNQNFIYRTVNLSLAAWSLTAGAHYQFEFTREGQSGNDTLVGDMLLRKIQVEFT